VDIFRGRIYVDSIVGSFETHCIANDIIQRDTSQNPLAGREDINR
jgi:hypothetical protein